MNVSLTWPPRHLCLPKTATLPEECEDAYAYGVSRVDSRDVYVAAIADGATESAFSGPWARQLTAHIVGDPAGLMTLPEAPITPGWLGSPRRAYAAGLEVSALPWHAQAAAARGSFATLVCLMLDLERRCYHAVAAGDSCLVIVRHERTAHPRVQLLPAALWDPAAFRRRPHLVGTDPAYDGGLPAIQHCAHGPLAPGTTTFLLMTDALAAWFVGEHLRGRRPWRTLAGLQDPQRFTAFVDHARRRSRRTVRDDDMTLVRLLATVTRERER